MSEKDELAKINAAIEAQEASRGILPDEMIDAAIEALKAKRASLQAERSVRVDGDVKDSVIATGDFNEINVTEAKADEDALRLAYLNHVYEQTSQLALAGIDKRTQRDAEARLNLGSVYTALLTNSVTRASVTGRLEGARSFAKDVDRHLSALEQLNESNRLVLLGDPGSGKTTFVNFVALCLTGASLKQRPNLADLTTPLPSDEDDIFDEFRDQTEKPISQPWEHGKLLPVRVILRDFAARGLPSLGETACANDLIAFIKAELESSGLGEYARPLMRHLREKGGLLMLDGLDEVPEAEQRRAQIKAVVEDFASTNPKCRILVTSRTYAYQKQDWRLNGFREAILAPFSQGQIEQFVERWYAHIAILRKLNEADAKGRATLLKRAITNNDRLRGLAERPLLLTLMASLHAWRGGTLPEKREELYADTVDLLLDWWENQRIVRDAKGNEFMLPSLAEWLKVDRKKVRTLLNKLAYQAHAGQKELTGTADVAESDLIAGLMLLSNNPDVKPKRLIEFLTARAGLLLPRGVGVYTFPHRTFQEYLAACHLTDDHYPDKIAKLSREDVNRWREVCLLAGAKATSGSSFALWALVDALAPQPPDEGAQKNDFWGALLAGQAILENIDENELGVANQIKKKRVRDWQIAILQSDLPPVERALAGDSLAALGDSRFDPAAWYLPKEENLGFIHIPAGEFIMGSDNGREKPQHKLTLHDYWMVKYPVTVAQFRAFAEAANYTGFSESALSDPDNRPVRYVTWYNALAYSEWLSEELSVFSKQKNNKNVFWQGLAGGELRVTLPSEAEWEKAARGPSTPMRGQASSGTGHIYPWGNDFDLNKVNSRDTGIGTTSAVGAFPAGASPYGVLDMSGNVWEWTRSLWGKNFNLDYPYPYNPADAERENLQAERNISRVLRGGAFVNDPDYLRCAYRFRYNPSGRHLDLGFRIVVSPSSSV